MNFVEFFRPLLGLSWKVYENVIHAAQQTFTHCEQESKNFIMSHLDLDDHLRRRGWTVLLESMSDSDKQKLRDILNKKDK